MGFYFFFDDDFFCRLEIQLCWTIKASTEYYRFTTTPERYFYSRFPHMHMITATAISVQKETNGWEAIRNKKNKKKRCWSFHQKAQILNNDSEQHPQHSHKATHEIGKHEAVKIFSENHKFYGLENKNLKKSDWKQHDTKNFGFEGDIRWGKFV